MTVAGNFRRTRARIWLRRHPSRAESERWDLMVVSSVLDGLTQWQLYG